MQRCAPLLAALALALPLAAAAQVQRNFPQNALRGLITVGAPPQIVLNGQPAQLAPGARIRGGDNLLVMSGALVGQRYTAHYTVDSVGLVKDVWLLRSDELARFWPKTPAEAARLVFDPVAQTWSRP
jgi:hypothetical protein